MGEHPTALIALFAALATTMGPVPSAGAQTATDKLRWTRDITEINFVAFHMTVFEDPSATMTFEDVRSSTDQFAPLGKVVNLGFSSSAFWLRVSLTNDSDQDELYFGAAYAFFDELELFVVREDGSYTHTLVGDTQPAYQRPIQSANFVIPFPIPTNQTVECYVRVQARESLFPIFSIWNEAGLRAHEHNHNIIQGVVYGSLAIMFLYNLGIFLFSRLPSYLFYVLYLGFETLSLATYRGLGFFYLWPDSIDWHHRSIPVLTLPYLLSFLFLCRTYLQTKETSQPLDNLIKFCIFATLLTIPIAFFAPIAIALQSATFITFLSNLVGLIACVRQAQRGYRPAYYFLLAFVFPTTIVAVQMYLILIGAGADWTYEFVLGYPLEWSTITQAALLSLGLADLIDTMRQETAVLQASTLRFQETARAELESEVERQTRELKQTLEDLETTQGLLVQQARLATVGNLVSGMAHEIGNPLNLTVGGAEKLHEILEEAASRGGDLGAKGVRDANTCANLVLKGSHRIEGIVRNLNQLAATGQSPKRQSCDIRDTFRATLEILEQQLLASQVTIDLHVPPNLRVHANSGELSQVFLNIVLNAAQAMDGEGAIDIGAHVANDVVVIDITDTGPGIPSETRDQIFDAFFTTKEQGEGMGLGLSISHQIIRDSEGALTLEDSEVGAHFRITLLADLGEAG